MPLIYLITHGEKADGVDPGLTFEGEQQIIELRHFLFKGPENSWRKTKPLLADFKGKVVCGIGRRHKETASLLRLQVDEFCEVVGVRASKDRATGMILLPDGSMVSAAEYRAVQNRAPKFFELLEQWNQSGNKSDNDYLVITSRPMIGLILQRPGVGAYCFKLNGEGTEKGMKITEKDVREAGAFLYSHCNNLIVELFATSPFLARAVPA